MTKTFVDPEHGEITAPTAPSKAEYDAARRAALEAIQGKRLWPQGSVQTCPSCGRDAFVGRDDLSKHFARPGAVLVFRHLQGARCEACHAESLEPAEVIAIEAETGIGIHPDYEAKVSRIGSGTIGTYWPKDVVRTLGLEPDTRVFIEVVDRQTALVHFKPKRNHGTPNATSAPLPPAERRARKLARASKKMDKQGEAKAKSMRKTQPASKRRASK